MAVAPADVETRIAAVAEVARTLVAGQAHEVEDAGGASLHQILGARVHRASFEQHVTLRHDELNRDLPFHVDVLDDRWVGGADVDERRGQYTAGNTRRRQW